jgi:hypothetical protein
VSTVHPPEPRPVATRVADLLRVADPGLTRGLTTARSLLAGGLAGGLAAALLTVLGQSLLPAGLVGLVALLGVVTLPPGPPRQWAPTTTAATLVTATVAAVVGDGPLGLTLVVVTCVAGAAGARFGGTGRAAGFVAFVVHVLGLRFALDTGDLLGVWLVLLLPAPAVLVTVGVLLRSRPVPTARRLARALYAELSLVADAADRLLLHGPGRRRQRRLRRRLVAGQEVALLLDSVLDEVTTGPDRQADPDGLRRAVLDVEALADHLVWAVLNVPPGTPAGTRRALADSLRDGRAPDGVEAGGVGGIGGDTSPLVPDLVGGNDRIDEVVVRLAGAAERLRRLGGLPGAVRAARATTGAEPQADGVMGVAVRVGLGSALALVLGLAVAPGEWHWAVIGAYIVVTTTASRGAGVRKALDRATGTAVGVAAGLGLAALLDGSVALVGLVLSVAAFVWVFRVSYALFMVALTVAVALLYELTGQLTVEVLALRLAETAIGAAAAALVVSVVLPVPTRSTVDGAVATLLAALDDALVALAGGGPVGADQVRAVDRAVSALRDVTEPVATGTTIGLGRSVRAAGLLATALRVRVGALATATATADTTGGDPTRAAAVAVVRARLALLRSDVAGAGVLPPDDPDEVPTGDDPVLDVLRAIDDRLAGYGTARGLRLRGDPGALAAGSPSVRD